MRPLKGGLGDVCSQIGLLERLVDGDSCFGVKVKQSEDKVEEERVRIVGRRDNLLQRLEPLYKLARALGHGRVGKVNLVAFEKLGLLDSEWSAVAPWIYDSPPTLDHSRWHLAHDNLHHGEMLEIVVGLE